MVHTNHFCLISDTGKGVLYTSDADGIVFSESLRDHVVSFDFATRRTRYVLVLNKFATYFFLWTIENIPLIAREKNLLVYLSLPNNAETRAVSQHPKQYGLVSYITGHGFCSITRV